MSIPIQLPKNQPGRFNKKIGLKVVTVGFIREPKQLLTEQSGHTGLIKFCLSPEVGTTVEIIRE